MKIYVLGYHHLIYSHKTTQPNLPLVFSSRKMRSSTTGEIITSQMIHEARLNCTVSCRTKRCSLIILSVQFCFVFFANLVLLLCFPRMESRIMKTAPSVKSSISRIICCSGDSCIDLEGKFASLIWAKYLMNILGRNTSNPHIGMKTVNSDSIRCFNSAVQKRNVRKITRHSTNIILVF